MKSKSSPELNEAVHHYQQRPWNPSQSWQGMEPVSSSLPRDILAFYYYFSLLQHPCILQKSNTSHEEKTENHHLNTTAEPLARPPTQWTNMTGFHHCLLLFWVLTLAVITGQPNTSSFLREVINTCRKCCPGYSRGCCLLLTISELVTLCSLQTHTEKC